MESTPPARPTISIVAAIGRRRELGRGNELLWHIPDDLRRFKALTLGHPVIMGRKTFESIVAMLGKPLPERANIVVTRDSKVKELVDGASFQNVFVANSIEEALATAKSLDEKEVFIGGGAQIYEQALPYADKLYLTLIDDEKDADAFFPPYEEQFKKIGFHEHREHQGLNYSWVDIEK